MGISRSKGWLLAGAIAGATVGAAGTANAAWNWRAWNTCWADFDVSAGRFCGLRTPQCAQPGLYCTTTNGDFSGTIPPPNPYGNRPAAKAIALDTTSRAFLLANDNTVWTEPLQPTGNWQLVTGIPNICFDRIVVVGSWLNGTRIMLRACGGVASTAYVFDGTNWQAVATDVVNFSKGTWRKDNTERFFVMRQAGGNVRQLYMSAPIGQPWSLPAFQEDLIYRSAGSAAFWPYEEFKPSLTAGRFLLYQDPPPSCNTSSANREWFVDVPETPHIGVTSRRDSMNFCSIGASYATGFPPIEKIVEGRRGPGQGETLWVRTNISRIYSLEQTDPAQTLPGETPDYKAYAFDQHDANVDPTSIDWAPGQLKAQCFSDMIGGLSSSIFSTGIARSELCVLGRSYGVTTPAINGPIVDFTNSDAWAGTAPYDWDPGYIKGTCGGLDFAISGVSQTADGRMSKLRCGYDPWYYSLPQTSACTTHAFGAANAMGNVAEGADWDPGFAKVNCDVNQTMKGVSHNAAGRPHAILCCNNFLKPNDDG